MDQPTKPVSDFLNASRNAQALAHLDLGCGRSTTIWQNRDDHVIYDAPQGHTFSFYLTGGEGTWRTDGTPIHGWPGAVCVMPQGHRSVWDITKSMTFVHLYLPDPDLRRIYAELFDRDARLFDLADKTYVAAEQLAAPFTALVRSLREGDPARADEASMELVGRVLTSGRFGLAQKRPLSGGLSQHQGRLLREFVEANLDRSLTLRDLAAVVERSEFHLQRSFRQAFGVSPQLWIAARRVERAKTLMRQSEPLAQIASACGYSSQSHFSRAFKLGTGATPGAWRKAMI
ncbi:MAG: helix-turn-helix domain-containing protein [Rhodospirillaceae bacterium]